MTTLLAIASLAIPSVTAGESIQLPDGGFLVPGPAASVSGTDYSLIRYASSGAVATHWQLDGRAMTGLTDGIAPPYMTASTASVHLMHDRVYVIGTDVTQAPRRKRLVVRRLFPDSLTPDVAWADAGEFRFEEGMESHGVTLVDAGQGRLVVGGFLRLEGPVWPSPVLVRLTAEGRPDATFGVGGRVLHGPFAGTGGFMSVQMLADGKMLQASDATGTTTRLLASGVIDPSYGFRGSSSPPAGTFNGVRVLSDGSALVVKENFSREIVVTKLTAAGAIDTSFGSNGHRAIPALGTEWRRIRQIIVDSQHITLIGRRSSDNPNKAGTVCDGFIVQMNLAGTLVATFGSGGVARLDTGATGDDFHSAHPAPGGGWWVFGLGGTYLGDQRHLIGRVTASGAWDTTFNGTGFRITAGGAGLEPPKAARIPDRGVAVGEPFVITLWPHTFTDSNGDTLALSASDVPAGCTFTPASATLSGQIGSAGTSTVTITATDGTGGSVSAQLRIIASAIQRPPPPLSKPYITVRNHSRPLIVGVAQANQTVHVFINGSQVAGHLDMDLGGTWTFRPDRAYALSDGAHVIHFTVSNGPNSPHSLPSPVANVLIDTIPPATPPMPTVTGSGSQIMVTGKAEPHSTVVILRTSMGSDLNHITLADVSANGSGNYSWQVEDLTGGGFNGLGWPIVVAAYDAAGNRSEESSSNSVNPIGIFSLPVVVANPVPSLTAVINQRFAYSIPLDTFRDPEGGPVFTRGPSWLTLPPGIAFDESTSTLYGYPSAVGTWEFVTFGLDRAATAATWHTVQITVVAAGTPTNNPPIRREAIPDQHAQIDQPFLLDLGSEYFFDVDGDPLTLSASDLAPGLVLTGSRITGFPNQLGVWMATITANDGRGGTISSPLSITVAGVDLNVPPVVRRSIPDYTTFVGSPVSITIPVDVFQDPDGDLLTIQVLNLPSGLSFTAGSGLISGTVSSPLIQEVTVRADDGNGGSAELSFRLSILDPANLRRITITSSAVGVIWAAQPAAPFIDDDGQPAIFDGILPEYDSLLQPSLLGGSG